MGLTKQEEYDASKDPFDPKVVYVAIEEINACQLDIETRIRELKKAAYAAVRALEQEREVTRRLAAKVERFEQYGLKHEASCQCNRCTEGSVL